MKSNRLSEHLGNHHDSEFKIPKSCVLVGNTFLTLRFSNGCAYVLFVDTLNKDIRYSVNSASAEVSFHTWLWIVLSRLPNRAK